jgi:hypothetical protein
LNFIDKFSKNAQLPNFIKILAVGTELFHVDGRTDGRTDKHDKADNNFLSFYDSA